MKRYFLGLALALFAIPGISRADVQTLSNGNGTGQLTDLDGNFTQYLYFKTANVPGNAFTFDNLRLYGGSAGFGGTIVLTLYSGTTQASQIGDAVSYTGGMAANSGADIGLGDFGTFFATNSSFNIEINVNFNTDTDIATNTTSTLTTLSGSGVFQVNNFSNANLGDLDPSGPDGKFLRTEFTASVPEPTTMILTGSVLAAGFGASMLRRLRKKTEEKAAI